MMHIVQDELDSHRLIGGRWLLDRQLGEGGQGAVWSAFDAGEHLSKATQDYWVDEHNVGAINIPDLYKLCSDAHEPEYAVKILTKTSKKALARFGTEIEAMTALSGCDERIIGIHEHHIPTTHDNASSQDPFLVMDLIEGASLRKLAKLGTWHLDILKCLNVFREIVDTVRILHSSSPVIIHRDLHPENVMLRLSDNLPILLDFGICYLEGSELVTSPDEQVGARFYIAPELADPPHEKVSASSDIYSLGKILYFMLSGGEIFDRERHKDERRDLRIRDGVTKQMEYIYRIFDGTIVEDINQRYQSTDQLIQVIDNVVDLIKRGFEPGKDGRRCIFCGEGEYVLLTDNNTKQFWQGSRPAYAGHNNPELYICNKCGNLQNFLEFPGVARVHGS